MKYYIMTLISIVAVLAIKSYTINAQGRVANDGDVEIMAKTELLNKEDTIRHQKMINQFLDDLEKSEFVYGKYAGSAEFPTYTYLNFERIQRVGTPEELNALLAHESAVVRVYAHQALTTNQMEIPTETLEALMMDSAEVICVNGMEISKARVMDLVAENLFQPTQAVEDEK